MCNSVEEPAGEVIVQLTRTRGRGKGQYEPSSQLHEVDLSSLSSCSVWRSNFISQLVPDWSTHKEQDLGQVVLVSEMSHFYAVSQYEQGPL